MLAPLPSWITAVATESLLAAAFRSGAALAHLPLATAADHVPHALWRDRLALAAAEVSARIAGCREGASAMRDALHLTKLGDDLGPAGSILRQWSRAASRPISISNLGRVLEGVAPERIALNLNVTVPTPVDRAALVVEAVLTDNPSAETAALLLADAAVARALGATHVLPLTLKPRDLHLWGDDLRPACHRAVVSAVGQALQMAGDLARAAARLRAVAPKLRDKAVSRAVELFLSHDVLAPAALTFLSARAARRLCDRLVSLGVLRELTGRDTFRLYGV